MRKIDPVRQAAKRRQILDAATRCFAQKGFHGASTNDICAVAGMSPGNLFHYFPNKAALISAIAEEERAYVMRLFAQAHEAEDVMQAFETLALQLLGESLDPVVARIGAEVMAEALVNPEIRRIYAESDRAVRRDLVTLLQRGIDKGQIDPELDIDAAATWLIALGDGGVTRAQMDPDFRLDTHSKTLVRMLRGLLLKPAA